MVKLIVLEDCCTIQLTKGKNTLVDRDKWFVLRKHKFQAQRSYSMIKLHPNGVWQVLCSGKRLFEWQSKPTRLLHRMLIPVDDAVLIDHRNGDELDNRCSNLRTCDRDQNARNQRRVRGASRFKGVCREGKSWVARVRAGDNTVIRLGRFKSEVEAARCYDAGAREHHGEFACTNEDLLGKYWKEPKASCRAPG